jgi:hypothetical protein
MSDFGISEIAAAASLVGTGVSAIGAISSGNAAAAQANYQSQVAKNNQTIANQNAAYATEAGTVAATDKAMAERAQQGATTAALAASGFDVNSGSAADVRTSQREVGDLNVERVRQQAALTAYGYRTQATGFGATAQLEQASAGFDTTAGYLKAGGSLLSGAKDLSGVGSLLSGSPSVPSNYSWMTDPNSNANYYFGPYGSNG